MTDQCQYLEYRPLSEAGDSGGGGDSDDADGLDRGAEDAEPRAYCTAVDTFVQTMRADICNRRYGLDPETDCEFYRDAEGLPEAPEGEVPEGEAPEGDAAATGATDAGGD